MSRDKREQKAQALSNDNAPPTIAGRHEEVVRQVQQEHSEAEREPAEDDVPRFNSVSVAEMKSAKDAGPRALLDCMRQAVVEAQPAPLPKIADIPRAVHHLTKAATHFAGIRYHAPAEALADAAFGLIQQPGQAATVVGSLEVIAAVLDLDHNAKQAAADVRAAIEVLR